MEKEKGQKWRVMRGKEGGRRKDIDESSLDYSSLNTPQCVPLLGWTSDVEDVDHWCPIPLVKPRQGCRLLRRSHDSPPAPEASQRLKVMLLTSEQRVENMKKEK